MIRPKPLTRRGLLRGGALATGGLLLAGCDRLNGNAGFRGLLRNAEGLTMRAQRVLTARDALAREYTEADLSPFFRGNGTQAPQTSEYQAFQANNFADWRLTVDGLVQRPMSLSLAQIAALPRRAQITRHDCVEGWSAIGKWTGTPLGPILSRAGLRDDARFIVFHCMDRYGSLPYYESVDLIDAFHPQTILAYALNDQWLPVRNGAPLRLRVERMLGYKHAKYLQRIEARASLDGLHGGMGGLWEDTTDYEWFAAI